MPSNISFIIAKYKSLSILTNHSLVEWNLRKPHLRFGKYAIFFPEEIITVF